MRRLSFLHECLSRPTARCSRLHLFASFSFPAAKMPREGERGILLPQARRVERFPSCTRHLCAPSRPPAKPTDTGEAEFWLCRPSRTDALGRLSLPGGPKRSPVFRFWSRSSHEASPLRAKWGDGGAARDRAGGPWSIRPIPCAPCRSYGDRRRRLDPNGRCGRPFAETHLLCLGAAAAALVLSRFVVVSCVSWAGR